MLPNNQGKGHKRSINTCAIFTQKTIDRYCSICCIWYKGTGIKEVLLPVLYDTKVQGIKGVLIAVLPSYPGKGHKRSLNTCAIFILKTIDRYCSICCIWYQGTGHKESLNICASFTGLYD